METGLEEGMAKGMAKGIQTLILDNMEEGIPRERIIEKLCHRFSLGEDVATAYHGRYTAHDNWWSNMMRGKYGTRKTLYEQHMIR